MLVFVYGTLMKGFNNHRLLDNSEYIGDAVIKGNCYSLPSDIYPVVVSGENNVLGEIYDVTSRSVLMRLDCLEGYYVDSDSGMYLRRKTMAKTLEGKDLEVSYYLYNKNIDSNARLVESGSKWKRNS